MVIPLLYILDSLLNLKRNREYCDIDYNNSIVLENLWKLQTLQNLVLWHLLLKSE